LISIYYTVDIEDLASVPVADKVFDFEEIEDAQRFRWVALDGLSPEDLTFPIDRRVAEMIRR
jgi:8-oxo-dGTP diphosphatase